MVVDVFFSCVHDGFSVKQRENLIKILSHIGDTPSESASPQCCGQHAHLSGFPKIAKSYAETFIRTYPFNRPLITTSTSCLGYMKRYFDVFFFNTSLHNELKGFQSHTYDISQYLVNVKKVTQLGAKFEGAVAYYKSCAASEKCALKNEPELLLKEVEMLTLITLSNKSCCGAGALFPISHPEYAEKLALYELQQIIDAGAEYITSTDANCLAHFDNIIKKHNFSIITIHLVDILASGY